MGFCKSCCCCLPKCCRGNDDGYEVPKAEETPTPPTSGKSDRRTATTSTSPTDPSSRSSKTTTTGTSTRLDKYFSKKETRVIPPPPGPPKTGNKIKISKVNAVKHKKGPAPQPPTSPRSKSPNRSINNNVSKRNSDNDTYANQMSPHIKSISQYSMFKASKNKAPPASPGPVRNKSVIKRTVSPIVAPSKKPQPPPRKKTHLKKKPSSVPTVLIAPSDYEHIFSSKEKIAPRPGQPPYNTALGQINGQVTKPPSSTGQGLKPPSTGQGLKTPSSEPKESKTFLNAIANKLKPSTKGPAPQPPVSPPPPPTEQVTKVPSEPKQHQAAPSFPPPVPWEADDDNFTEIKTQPSDEMFREMFKNHNPSQEQRQAEKVPSPPTLEERTPTDPTLDEVVNQAVNQDVNGQGPPPRPPTPPKQSTPPKPPTPPRQETLPDGRPQSEEPLPYVPNQSPSVSSIGSKKEQLDKLKNLLTKK